MTEYKEIGTPKDYGQINPPCSAPRLHEEDEEAVPMETKGLWPATSFDEWGIRNAPGAGLAMSEVILEGTTASTDIESPDPKHWLNISSMR